MTPLEKTLKRELSIDGRAFIVAISPQGIKLTLKGKRNGQELKWQDLVSGDAALAVALNASLGGFAVPAGARAAAPQSPPTAKPPAMKPPTMEPPAMQRASAKPPAMQRVSAKRAGKHAVARRAKPRP